MTPSGVVALADELARLRGVTAIEVLDCYLRAVGIEVGSPDQLTAAQCQAAAAAITARIEALQTPSFNTTQGD